jgi:predicted ATPase
MRTNQFIKNIRVSNFKSILNADIELAPLNVVVGRNSAGKSSLMHSILLATQHLSSDFIADDRISLNRNLVNLGTFREVLNFSENLDASVSLGIETEGATWEIEFVQKRDVDGKARLQSREAEVKKLHFKETAPAWSRSKLQVVEVLFDISEFSSRTTPVLLEINNGRRSEMPFASGKGTISYFANGFSNEVTRAFDYCIFLPHAQDRIHPLPLERVDFFHHVVERFYNVCIDGSRRETFVRRRSNAANLVANSEVLKGVQIDQFEIGRFFEYLVSRSSITPSHVYEVARVQPLKDRLAGRDAVEQSAYRLMESIFLIRRQPFQISRDYFESPRNLSSNREMLGKICTAVAEMGVSELKAILIPILQRAFELSEMPILKPISIEFSNNEDEDEVVVSDDALVDFLERGRDRLTRASKNVYYLGPIRDLEYPSASLPDPRNLGPKGEQAVEVLVHEANSLGDFPLPESSTLGSDETDFATALSEWLRHLGLAKGVKTEDQGRDKPRMVVIIDDEGNSVDIRSVGQGISQLLPVLMQCLLAKPGGSLVIVEQPELHLHPRLESQLADFFLACARTGRQIFVETHSEHLINRLRLRIANDATNETRELIQVLFADQVDGVTTFNKAFIDEYGGLEEDEWPTEFLQLNVEAAEQLIDAAIDKRIHQLESDEETQVDDDDEDDF